jgi:hypothetical protein
LGADGRQWLACTFKKRAHKHRVGLLAISGHYVDFGLLGDRIDIPLFPRINREQTFYGSNWGTTPT